MNPNDGMNLQALAKALNDFDPNEVHHALEAVHGASPASASRGATTAGVSVASGPLDFGSVPSGVLVIDAGGQQARLRITVAEVTGAFYDEIEGSEAAVRRVASEILERLRQAHSAPVDAHGH